MELITNTSFWNDLCDVARLFLGDAPISAQEENAQLCIRHHSAGGEETAIITSDGVQVARHSVASPPPGLPALEEKRLQKRAAKTALYQALQKWTGVHPPWGALTGIRPTRLLADAWERLGGEDKAMEAMVSEFDVMPEKAALLRDIVKVQRGIVPPAGDECDVYVGIPFCATRCSYCSFAAVGLKQGARWVEPYLAALECEIRAGVALMRKHGYRVRAVYVGGGTPTSLSAGQLEHLLGILRELLPEAYEWTVEAGRPDTIDEPKLLALRKQGVERISINPQTMNNQTLALIGRDHSAQDIIDCMKLARSVGFSVINMDLIAALPGEKMPELTHSVEQVLELHPENITVHALAVKRASELRMTGQAQLPPVELAAQMIDFTSRALRGTGYQPYYLYRQKYMAGNLENVGYAMPSHACLYNIDNMEEIAPILAFGAGAISKWIFSRELRIERAPNVKNIEEYIARVQEMVLRKQRLMEQP